MTNVITIVVVDGNIIAAFCWQFTHNFANPRAKNALLSSHRIGRGAQTRVSRFRASIRETARQCSTGCCSNCSVYRTIVMICRRDWNESCMIYVVFSLQWIWICLSNLWSTNCHASTWWILHLLRDPRICMYTAGCCFFFSGARAVYMDILWAPINIYDIKWSET